MRKVILGMILITATLTSAARTFDKDRGGGNLYKGRPLESYIQDPLRLEAARTVMATVQKVQSVDVQRILTYALTRKSWYFVPGPLDQLSTDKIGAAMPTEQGALQNFSSVWIDQELFVKMSLADQSDLLLHEALMGMRLMRFASIREQCFTVITRPENFYQCNDKNPHRTGKASDLSAKDYEDIRRTVVDLKNLPGGMSYDDISEFFGARGFGFPFLEFRRKTDHDAAHGVEVIQAIQEASLSGYSPTYLYKFDDFYSMNPGLKDGFVAAPIAWLPKGHCRLDPFKVVNGRLVGRYITQKNRSTSREFKLDFSFNPDAIYLRGLDITNPLGSRQPVLAWGESFTAQKKAGVRSVGDRLVSMAFLLDEQGLLDGVHVEEFVIVKAADEPNQSNIGEQISPVRNGVNEICSVQSQRMVRP